MTDYVFIGSSPCDEVCVQTVDPNYAANSKLELNAFKAAIIAKFGEPPAGAHLTFKEGEVICRFETDNAKAMEYAFKCEEDAPKTWGECEDLGVKRPRFEDPEFTKTELIAVPLGNEKTRVVQWNGDAPTVCDMSHDRIVNCKNPITNEFVDGRTKQGPWGNLCPNCHARWGVGIGTGFGQRYKKAVDGNFYKTEG
jgi:hypothetical protein